MRLITPGIPMLGAWLYQGCYDVEGYDFEYTNVFTNNTFTDAYRGAGRPEATYAIERAMDALARKLDMDPVALRFKNFISDDKFPNYTIASGLTIDSANYKGTLEKCLGVLGYEEFRAEQKARRESGSTKVLGVGFSTWLEMCGLAPSRVLAALKYIAGGWDAATIEFMPTGTVRVLTGISPHGQGEVTTFSQIVADQLGVDFEDVEVLHGDTQVIPLGMDTYGSRGLAVGGVALWKAGEKIIEKARAIAAHELECSEDDLEFAGGNFTVRGTDRTANIKALGFSAWSAHNLPDGMEPGLNATHLYDPPNFSWPNGAHACVLEVDTETGSDRPAALHRGRRLRRAHQPDGGRGPGPRRRGAGHRRGALRGGDLRRGGQPPARHHDHLHGPRAARAALVRARSHRHSEPDERDGREGRRGGRHHRRPARRDQRGGGRPLAPRRHQRRAPGDPRESVERDPGGQAMITAPFDYEVAESVDHALELLRTKEDPKLIAGGHSLLPLMKLRLARPGHAGGHRPPRSAPVSATRATTWPSVGSRATTT